MPRRDRLTLITSALKLAITLGLFAYLLRKVEIAPVVRQLRAMAPAAAVAAEALLLLQLALLALRWHLVNRIVDAPMRASQVLRLTAIGHFFNQVLPSGFAGDAARAWLAAREGVQLGPLVRAIVCDRVVGLLVLVLMVSLTFFALPDVAADKVPARNAFGVVALLGVAAAAALFLLGAPVADLLMRHRLTSRSAGSLPISIACSFAPAAGARSSSCSRRRCSFSTWRRYRSAQAACASISIPALRSSSCRRSCSSRWRRSRSPAGACAKAP